jgi:hypothetical protein
MKESITITHPVRAAIVIAVSLAIWAALGVAIAKADEPCDGYPTVDGCMTIERYNELFSYDVLSNIESLTFPGQSIAEVYGITDDGVAPVDRPRDFMGEPLPTVREVIEGRLWMT